MQVDITARHFSLSDKLRELIHDKIEKISKFNNSIMNCNVILTKHSTIQEVEIIIHAKGCDFVAHENSDNFEKSLIIAVDKIKKQVKRQHNRLVDH